MAASPTMAAQAGRYQLSLSTEWLSATVVRITVSGDVDAANAAELTDYVFHRAANSRRFVLDLQRVEFFGTAGFTALKKIESRSALAEVVWTVIPSRAVARVLDVCDPRRTLPIATAATN
jgi:anti-anti-sigma factor